MAHAAAAPVKYAGRTYLIEFVAAMVLYCGAIGVRPWLIDRAGGGTVLIVVAKLLPILPVWLLFAVVWRHYRRIDEFARHQLLVNLAIAFGIGSSLIVSFVFLADVGLPPLAFTWAWPTLAACWAITSAIRSMADR